jgi:dihydroneopterin triphosphate diphosphatase
MTSAPIPSNKPKKIPLSVLVLVYTQALDVLLIKRAIRSSGEQAFWQSVTGSVEPNEVDKDLRHTAQRELLEETGIACKLSELQDWRIENRFLIYPEFAHRYADDTTHNTEHVFALQLAEPVPVTLAPNEHTESVWLPWQQAAAQVRSWSNRDVIERLPQYATLATREASL